MRWPDGELGPWTSFDADRVVTIERPWLGLLAIDVSVPMESMKGPIVLRPNHRFLRVLLIPCFIVVIGQPRRLTNDRFEGAIMSNIPKPTTRTGARGRLAAVACAAGLGLVAFAAPVGAQEISAAPQERAAAEIPPRLERACLRIPNLTIRTGNMIERISGDADTIGSLAWLDAKIAQAEEKGRTDLVTVLTNRRAVREQTIPVLELRLDRLEDLRQRCADAGVDV